MFNLPDRWTDGELRDEIDVRALTDEELCNLFHYRSALLAYTFEGHPDRATAAWRHAVVWAEIEQRHRA